MFLEKFTVIVLLAIAANLDNLGVGIAYGLRGRYISLVSNLTIALISGILTLAAMLFGKWLETFLSARLANDMGAFLIIGVGVWVCWESIIFPICLVIYKSLQKAKRGNKYSLRSQLSPSLWFPLSYLIRKKNQTQKKKGIGNFESSNFENNIAPKIETYLTGYYPVQFRETILLGISLSLNAIAGGLGASLSGYDATLTSIAIGLFSYITISLGQNLSRKYFNKLIGTLSQQISGLLLIGIGIYEMLF